MYVKIENNKITSDVLSFRDIRMMHPKTSFPSGSDELGLQGKDFVYKKVIKSDKPESTTKAYDLDLQLIDGVPTEVWIERDFTQEEIDNGWEVFNMVRDEVLLRCDWTQANHSPLSEEKKAEWLVYIKAVRDIPQNQNNPFNIVWPDKPE